MTFDNSCGNPGCLACFLARLHEQPRVNTPYSNDVLNAELGAQRRRIEILDDLSRLRRFYPTRAPWPRGTLP